MGNNVEDNEQHILESPFTQESIIKFDEQYDSSQDVFESQISNRIPEKGALLSDCPVVKSEDQGDCKPYLLSLLGNDTIECQSVKQEGQVDSKSFLLSKLGDASSDFSAKKLRPATLPNNSSQAENVAERKNKANNLSLSSNTHEADGNCISRVDSGQSYKNNANLDIKTDVDETQIDQALNGISNLRQSQQHNSSFKSEQNIPRRYVVIPEDQRVLLDGKDAWYDSDAVQKTQYAMIPQQVCNTLAPNLSQEQQFSSETTNSSICQWIYQERKQSTFSQRFKCAESEGTPLRSQHIPRRYFQIPNDQKTLLQSSDAWYDSSTNFNILRARIPPSIIE